MIGTEVLAIVEEEKVSAKVIGLTFTTTSTHINMLAVLDYTEVRPLRIENYPSLAKVWDEDDDNIFADEPGV